MRERKEEDEESDGEEERRMGSEWLTKSGRRGRGAGEAEPRPGEEAPLLDEEREDERRQEEEEEKWKAERKDVRNR